jgi:glycosyltransferase involved in cell wall biosynthesis
VFPSLYEGFGIPILEAQACGVPVVTSTEGSCPEVSGGAAVLVNPYSPDAIFEGIASMVRDPSLREKLIADGMKNAAKYSYDKHARELVGFFHSL